MHINNYLLLSCNNVFLLNLNLLFRKFIIFLLFSSVANIKMNANAFSFFISFKYIL